MPDNQPFSKIKDTLLYGTRTLRHSENLSNEIVSNAVSEIRKNGFVQFDSFLSSEELAPHQKTIQNQFEKGDIEYPCLAQSKIDESKHKLIIDNHLFASPERLKNEGLTFERDDFSELNSTIEKFRPSSIKTLLPSDNLGMYNLFLHPLIISIVYEYMGVHLYMIESYVRRNFPAKYRSMNHFWHRDLNHDDHLLKAFFFFTDCEKQHGPHEFVIGSHEDRTLSNKRYYTDEEVNELYPQEKRALSIVKAGTLVIEDTRGLHKANVPEVEHRDLGYAIFFPKPFYTGAPPAHYKILESTYNELSNFQKKFIPSTCIVKN
jgi:hypothetical protein